MFALHRFPTDENRRQQWVVKLRRLETGSGGGSLWQPGPTAVLCSQHFLPDDFYMQWSRKLVKPDSLPSVFSFAPPVKRRKAPMDRSTDNTTSIVYTEETVDNTEPAPASSASLSASISDHTYTVESPTKLCKKMSTLVERIRAKNSALRNARRREFRLRGKLAGVLLELKNKNLLSTQSQELLDAYKDIPLSLFKGLAGRAYTEDQKQFATTLHYYSPAAYEYLRSRVKSLPSPRTIRNWLSTYDGQPGLTQQSFDTIASNVAGPNAWAYKLCALHLDEMEIKKQFDYNRQTGKTHGFTDIGSGTFDQLVNITLTLVYFVANLEIVVQVCLKKLDDGMPVPL